MITSDDNRLITSGQGFDPSADLGPQKLGRGELTRRRLTEAGLRLFAERGFDAVSVGDIEEAVGLAPRRGALYRHFESKADLLRAATEGHLGSVTAGRDEFAATAAAATLDAAELGRWILAELDRQRLLTQVLERDGERLPELRDQFRSDISDAAYRGLADILRTWLAARASDAEKVSASTLDGLAVLLLGGLVNARRSTWTLGAPPLSMDDERLLDAWNQLCESALTSLERDRVRRGA